MVLLYRPTLCASSVTKQAHRTQMYTSVFILSELEVL